MSSRQFLIVALALAVAMGAYLRVDQLADQVVIEDEWHAVHQVIYYSLPHIVSTFGNADYSIPVTMLYWLQAKTVGLSELGLRWPMVAAGVILVAALPSALLGRLEPRIVALFAVLLAASPFLVSYSRIARSYALTLLGVYAAFWCLERAIRGGVVSWKPAAGYALLCGLVVWAHPVAGPMLVAPLIALWWAAWRGNGLPVRVLAALSAIAAFFMALAVLPPLLHDPGALSGKAGMDSVTLETLIGAWHLWLGTGSATIALLGLGFAVMGWAPIARTTPMARWIVLGSLLTVAAILVARPWWVDRPLAFGRYLLPAVPLILLTIAAGIIRAIDALWLRLLKRDPNPLGTIAVGLVLVVAWALTTPHVEMLRGPSSYTQHSYFQYDYRNERNPIRDRLQAHPHSPFWSGLASAAPGTLTIAVAPFVYSTYAWPAPVWESQSRQRVIPAFLWGSCQATRFGEVPPDPRFAFRNAVHVSEGERLRAKGIDYLVYHRVPPPKELGTELPNCEAWMRQRFGPPDHEDAVLLAWHVAKDRPGPTRKD